MDRFESLAGSIPRLYGELIIKERSYRFRSGKYAFTSERVLFDEGWNETIESGDLIGTTLSLRNYLDWLWSALQATATCTEDGR